MEITFQSGYYICTFGSLDPMWNGSNSSTQSSISTKDQSEFLVIFYSEDFSKMKYVEKKYLLAEAGVLMNRRDMSIYDGKSFECACGQNHEFYDHLNLGNFASTGLNAKMIVKCSLGTDAATIIQTKYKYLFIFDCFISLTGCKPTNE